jgi:hypothetical protein
MNDQTTDQPPFVIYGKIPNPRPQEPLPAPWKRPSDEVLSSNAEILWTFSAARPVVKNGQHTGEWQVSLVNRRNVFARTWIVKPNKDDAYEWCRKVERLRSRNV